VLVSICLPLKKQVCWDCRLRVDLQRTVWHLKVEKVFPVEIIWTVGLNIDILTTVLFWKRQTEWLIIAMKSFKRNLTPKSAGEHNFVMFFKCFFYYINIREQNFGRPSTIRQNRTSLNKGSLRGHVRRAGVLNQRCGTSLNTNTGSIGVPQAHRQAHAHKATLARTPAQWSGNLKHSNTFPIDAPQALKPLRACVRSNPPNRVLARNTDVYLWRFSPRKSSIEPSFSSYKDLEEILSFWSSIRGGLGLCSIFITLIKHLMIY
jgi:hypothetical protein